MRDALIVSALSIVPRKAAARAMGVLSRTGLSQLGTAAFVRAYGVDMSEAEHGLDAYPTLATLFTRRLKPGARPLAQAPLFLASALEEPRYVKIWLAGTALVMVLAGVGQQRRVFVRQAWTSGCGTARPSRTAQGGRRVLKRSLPLVM